MKENEKKMVRELLTELEHLKILIPANIPEITPRTCCEICHRDLPSQVDDSHGVVRVVGGKMNAVVSYSLHGKVYILDMDKLEEVL